MLFLTVVSEKVPYYILDLLQQVQSLYVKGLGRFDAIFHPAVVDLPEGKIKPPFLEPGFREGLSSDDTLLTEFIRYSAGCTLEEAEAAIQAFVDRVLTQTTEDSAYTISHFGTFTRTETGSLRFTPDWDAFNLTFKGLETLDLNPVKQEPQTLSAPVPVLTPVEITDISPRPTTSSSVTSTTATEEKIPVPPVEAQYSKAGSKLLWYVLLGAIVLIAGICFWLALDIIQQRSALLAGSTPEDTTSTLSEEVIAEDTIAMSETDTFMVQEPEENLTDTTQTTIIESPEVKPDTSHCYIVVGAFTSDENIQRMMVRLNDMGYTAVKLSGGNLTRVAIQSACERHELQQTLDKARSTIHPEAWIY